MWWRIFSPFCLFYRKLKTNLTVITCPCLLLFMLPFYCICEFWVPVSSYFFSLGILFVVPRTHWKRTCKFTNIDNRLVLISSSSELFHGCFPSVKSSAHICIIILQIHQNWTNLIRLKHSVWASVLCHIFCTMHGFNGTAQNKCYKKSTSNSRHRLTTYFLETY